MLLRLREKIATSPLGAYAASKFALEALSEVLVQEMKPLGVRVSIVESGFIDTLMGHAMGDRRRSRSRQGRHVAALVQALLGNPTPPSGVASAIRNVIENDVWKLRHPAGPDAEPFLS